MIQQCWGIDFGTEGSSGVLSVPVSLHEHEVHYRALLEYLVARGENEAQHIISDASNDLSAGRLAIFGAGFSHRYDLHLQQNKHGYVSR